MTAYNSHAHEDYIKAGKWKCDQSPIGAHFWIGNGPVVRCKYCGELKVIEQPLTLNEVQARERVAKKMRSK